MSSQTLFVVHCIDTEGPLKETLNATFARLNKTFRLNFKPSKKKLNDFQNKKIDLFTWDFRETYK